MSVLLYAGGELTSRSLQLASKLQGASTLSPGDKVEISLSHVFLSDAIDITLAKEYLFFSLQGLLGDFTEVKDEMPQLFSVDERAQITLGATLTLAPRLVHEVNEESFKKRIKKYASSLDKVRDLAKQLGLDDELDAILKRYQEQGKLATSNFLTIIIELLGGGPWTANAVKMVLRMAGRFMRKAIFGKRVLISESLTMNVGSAEGPILKEGYYVAATTNADADRKEDPLEINFSPQKWSLHKGRLQSPADYDEDEEELPSYLIFRVKKI